ncbi:DNA-directed DNA polymerase, partial [Powellomyces hirtus]
TILIYAPEGSGFPPGTILRLRKALYGLKQAPREWYSLLHKELTSLGFKRLANDNAVYIRTLPGSDSSQYISVYIDDLFIFAKNESEISSIKASLHNKFNMTDLGEVNHYLGMRVRHDYTRRVIYLDQESYVNDILERFVENTKTSPNPQEGEYREIVGSLMYLMICTRPDIAVAVSMLSRFASNPSPQHLQAAKRVLRYLRGTSTYSLCIGGNNVTLHGYSDADWGNNIIDRRSITGYLFCIGNAGPVTWASKRQPTVALSSTEAEYMALSFATQETIWLCSLLKELQIPEYLDENT